LLDDIRPASFVCLDSVIDREDGESDRHDTMADSSQPDPAEATSRHELAELILQRLQRLPDMQRKVLALYYFEDLRLREIAEVFGVTESRICQIHTQAILSIRALVRQEETCEV
jgi:RNA polymerase sigma factor for flagellar operon FliA